MRLHNMKRMKMIKNRDVYINMKRNSKKRGKHVDRVAAY